MIKPSKKNLTILFVLILSLFLIANFVLAKSSNFTEKSVCVVYFTGIGCPHCANADPLVLEELPKEYPNLVIIEYEIYQQRENAPLLYQYHENYNSGLGIPLIIFNKENYIIGDKPILQGAPKILAQLEKNKCPLPDGTSIDFKDLEISSLPGKPKIIRQEVSISGEESLLLEDIKSKLTLAKIVGLAGVDAVNPCALAVLTLMLIAILTYNPTRRREILKAGLAFTAAVFIMYLIYGLIIVKSFQFIQALTSIRLLLYKILGGAAILLGILNLKDFIRYTPGGFLTEMPQVLRPKVKKIISGITSPRGAFAVGLFVTLFLLPCTIGPYIIAGGILSICKFLEIIPCLLIYNLIFILPMLAITIIVYLGITGIKDVSSWKEKNIKYLHLAAGLIILGLGIAMILGLV